MLPRSILWEDGWDVIKKEGLVIVMLTSLSSSSSFYVYGDCDVVMIRTVNRPGCIPPPPQCKPPPLPQVGANIWKIIFIWVVSILVFVLVFVFTSPLPPQCKPPPLPQVVTSICKHIFSLVVFVSVFVFAEAFWFDCIYICILIHICIPPPPQCKPPPLPQVVFSFISVLVFAEVFSFDLIYICAHIWKRLALAFAKDLLSFYFIWTYNLYLYCASSQRKAPSPSGRWHTYFHWDWIHIGASFCKQFLF